MTQDDIITFISERKFMVISTNGGEYPESATVEYGNDGLTLIFDTNSTSRKFQNIQHSPKVSVVIGWDEEVNKTVQYQGIAEVLEGEELDRLKKVYFAKSPEAQKWENTKDNVYLKVSPKWVRMTDLNTDPWTISVFEFMDSFNQFTIPFGKFIDPNSLGRIRLIKHWKSESEIRDYIYLVEDVDNKTLYCCYVPDNPSDHSFDEQGEMDRFLVKELGNEFKIEMLEPKRKDWFVTHYLAKVLR